MSLPSTYRPFPPFAEWAELPVEMKFWRQALEELEDFRRRATPAQVEEAARYVTRATAVDTSAIEGLYAVDRGFTRSVAAQAGAWEQAFEEKGKNARQHFEAQLQASEVVLDAATGRWPVVETLIRGLHEQVCAAEPTYRVLTSQGWQEHELVRGEYKLLPNNPTKMGGEEHSYAPVERVRDEMERLVSELGSDAFARAPAPTQAAYAHYAFVSIHPFADGNGRVARALASIYLVRATSVPFLLFADERPAYFDALEAADGGSYRELIEMVRDRSIGAMNYMSLSLQKALAPKAGELRDSSRRLFYATPKLTHEQVDALAERLLDMVGNSFRDAFDRLELPLLKMAAQTVNGDPHRPPIGYRSLRRPDPPTLQIRVESPQPAFGRAGASLRALVASNLQHPGQVRIEESNHGERFDANLSDLYPDLSLSLRARLELWADALVATIASEAIRLGQESREKYSDGSS